MIDGGIFFARTVYTPPGISLLYIYGYRLSIDATVWSVSYTPLGLHPVKRDHAVCAHRAGSDPADYQEKGSKQPCIKKLLEKF